MDMKNIEEFEYLIRNESIPKLDKEKLLLKIMQTNDNKLKLRFKPKRSILISIISILLFSGLVFGEELVKLTKIIFKVEINNGGDRFALFTTDGSKYPKSKMIYAGTEEAKISTEKVVELTKFKKELIKKLEPGCRIYIMDDYGVDYLGEKESLSVEFINKPLEFKSLEELKSYFVPEFMTLGNSTLGYEFYGSEAFYNYGTDYKEKYEHFLTVKEELEGRLATSKDKIVYTIPEPITTHFDEIIIKYRNESKDPMERKLDIHIYYEGGAVEGASFSTDKIEKIKVGKDEVLYNITKRNVYYKKDGTVYKFILPYNFDKREIVELIKSLHY